MNFGPPEENLSSPDQNKVTKYSWMLEMYSGPPERDKVTSSGPSEENVSPLDQNKVTNSGLPEINSGLPEQDKVGRKTWLSKMGQNNEDRCLILVEPFSHVPLHWLYIYFNSTLVLCFFFKICES